MASLKDHGAAVAMVAVIFLATVLPSHASTVVDELAKYKPTAPPPTPASHSSPPPPSPASHSSPPPPTPASHSSPPPPSPASHSSPPPPPRPVQPVIVVQGLIYCKSCKLRGYNSGMDASPLPNATASLVCYGDEKSKYRVLNQTSTATDKNGYFLVMVYDVGMFDQHSCRLYLRSSPTPLCAAPFVPSNAKLGLTLVKDEAATAPRGALGIFHPTTALMYAPATAGKCPPY